MLRVELHVWFTVSTFVIFKITILGDELVRFLPLLLLQHWVSHLHVFAAKLMSRQELHNASSNRIPQNIGCSPQTVPTSQQETENEWANKWENILGTDVTPAIFEGSAIFDNFFHFSCMQMKWGEIFTSHIRLNANRGGGWRGGGSLISESGVAAGVYNPVLF